MSNKKRYCISLDKLAEDILEDVCEQFECSYSHAVEIAVIHMRYGLIEKCPYHLSKKLVDK